MGAGLSREDEGVVRRILDEATSKEIAEHPLLHRTLPKLRPQDSIKIVAALQSSGRRHKGGLVRQEAISESSSTNQNPSDGPGVNGEYERSGWTRAVSYFSKTLSVKRDCERWHALQTLWDADVSDPFNQPLLGNGTIGRLQTLLNARVKAKGERIVASIRQCLIDIMIESVHQSLSKAFVPELGPGTRSDVRNATADSTHTWKAVQKEFRDCARLSELKKACSSGARYIEIASNLGLGIIALLGEDATRSSWVKSMSFKDLQLALKHVANTRLDLVENAKSFNDLTWDVLLLGYQQFGFNPQTYPLALSRPTGPSTFSAGQSPLTELNASQSEDPASQGLASVRDWHTLRPIDMGLQLDHIAERSISFYFHIVSPSRSLIKQNLYLDILQQSKSSDCLSAAIISLGASYLRDVNDRYRHAALRHRETSIIKTREILSSPTIDSTNIMLALAAALIQLQYQLLDRNLHQEWMDTMKHVGQLLQLGMGIATTSAIRVKIASHAILAGTASPLHSIQVYPFLTQEEKSDQRIDVLTGLSPELLDIINHITIKRRSKHSGEPHQPFFESLAPRLCNLIQTQSANSDTLDATSLDILLKTAESYRIAAMIYLRCCLNSGVTTLRFQLFEILKILPTKGCLFTAVYPLWSVFIYCVTAIEAAERERAREIIEKLRINSARSNILPVLEAIEIVWTRDLTRLEPPWWENLVASVVGENFGMLSLT